MRPVIGITMDWQAEGSFSPRPYYALRQGYFDAVWASGGLPVALPVRQAAELDYLERVDGVLVPGGDYPSPGWWYGDSHGTSDHPRAEGDVMFIQQALARNIPFLGICAGHQTLGVAMGGQLIWKVKSLPETLDHREIDLALEAHEVAVLPGSLLATVTGMTSFKVNSHHNEAVKQAGVGSVVSGRASDGVIEALEVPGKRFALGVQWHPEFLINEADRRIFEGFVEAARQAAA